MSLQLSGTKFIRIVDLTGRATNATHYFSVKIELVKLLEGENPKPLSCYSMYMHYMQLN